MGFADDEDAERSPPPAAPATLPPGGSSPPATPASKKHWTSSPFFPFSTPSPSPAHHLFSASSPRTSRATPSKSPAPTDSKPTTPARRLLRLPFPPPSPAKHIRQALARRHGPSRPAIPEEGGDGEGGRGLDKGFGFNKGFAAKYDMGDEVGRGHFGYTCAAMIRKGARKGEAVTVRVIPKAKVMTMCNLGGEEVEDGPAAKRPRKSSSGDDEGCVPALYYARW